MPLSPFTSILRLYASNPNRGYENVETLLQSIVSEHSILKHDSLFGSLIHTLSRQGEWFASDQLYSFLDNCILRVVRKPIKYVGDLDGYLSPNTSNKASETDRSVSLLLMAVVEQWPFCERSLGHKAMSNIAIWIKRFIEGLWQSGESQQTLLRISSKLRSSTSHDDPGFADMLEVSRFAQARSPEEIIPRIEDEIDDDTSALRESSTQSLKEALDEALQPPIEPAKHPGIHQWMKRNISDAVEDGLIGDLVLCFCSQHEEIRRQALVNIKIIMSKLEVRHLSW